MIFPFRLKLSMPRSRINFPDNYIQSNSHLNRPTASQSNSKHSSHSKDSLPSSNNKNKQITNQIEDNSQQLELANQIRDYINSHVDVRWTMIGAGVGGKIELADWVFKMEELECFCLSTVCMSK